MTETDPGSAPAEPTAGQVGVHRKDITTEPLDDTEGSLNAPPQRTVLSAETPAHGTPDPAHPAESADSGENMRTTAKNKAAEVAERVREATPDSVKHAADKVTEKVREVTPDSVKHAADKVTEKVREVTPDSVKHAADKVTEKAKRSPAVAIAIAAAALVVLRKLLRRKGK